MLDPKDIAPESWMICGGRNQTPGAPLNVPIVPASNYLAGGERAYARDDGSPTWEALEQLVGGLEHGRAVSFSSGMAAIAAVFDQLPVGSRVALPSDCYQGVAHLAEYGRQLGRWAVTSIDIADTAAWIAAVATHELTWLESPSNPMLVVADLPAIAAADRGESNLLVVDNTFATPINQQPLAMGADVVIHSATKYLGGHSDLLTGIAVTARDAMHERLMKARTLCGATPGSLEAYLATRGIRTLALRLAASQATAGELAQRLSLHPKIAVVRYPGLRAHATHAIAARVMNGFGSMISFDVVGGAAAADDVCERVTLIRHATSLGSVESTIERRAALAGQEHVPAGLLRLSVGCEQVDDLWRDIEQALEPGAMGTRRP